MEAVDFQQRRIRILYWRTLVALLKEAHRVRFKNRRFGPDLQLLFVYGVAVLYFLEGKKARASVIARYLELPHETVRRHLKTLVKLGLLDPADHTFKPSSKIKLVNINKIESVMRQCAREILA
jgi:DNA-binding transcriptional ArsR family regulator